MRTAKLAPVCLAAIWAFSGPVLAQDQRADLEAVYVLWGMMEGAGSACWEIAGYDPSYMEELEGWKQRNIALRNEIDAARAAAGLPDGFASDSEAQGNAGIADIMHRAVNGPEACASWLADTTSGKLDTEIYMAEQLGRLRGSSSP